ncbi:MAG: hypothetical protein IJS32_08705, partial [Kiritimatiellae bacterium]|nr:hypothetical protein [Kiritimatiellia bacterium]
MKRILSRPLFPVFSLAALVGAAGCANAPIPAQPVVVAPPPQPPVVVPAPVPPAPTPSAVAGV